MEEPTKPWTWLEQSGAFFLPQKISNILDTLIYGTYEGTLYISYWTFMHMFSGVLFTFFVRYVFAGGAFPVWWVLLAWGILIHTVWELWQLFLQQSSLCRWHGPGNIVDIGVDTIAFIVGLLLAFGTMRRI